MKLAITTATIAAALTYATVARTAPKTYATAADQIAAGKALYVKNCATCHGDAGQGGKDTPPVVGKDAFPLEPRKGSKRTNKFHTAADVFAYASKEMPKKKPGSLSTDEYLAIFAFDLTANGIKLDKPLDGAAAAKIVLHP